MADKRITVTVDLTSTLTTNLLAPAAAGASAVGYTATADKLTATKLRVTNRTAAAHNFTFFKGATGANAAGTEVAVAKNVPANDAVEIFGNFVLEGATGFLVGGADANTALTLDAEILVSKV